MHEILRNKKVIFFDVGYTLDYPATGDWMFMLGFREIAGERLKRISPDRIREARAKGMEYLERNHRIHDEQEETERFCRYYRILSEELDLQLTEDEITASAKDRVCNMDNYVLYPDARRVLQELSQTHTLGIISDTWPSIEHQLQTLHLREYFSFATYSFELGVFKPDPEMYLDALRKCGHDASETVFIDDSPKNLQGAAELGITPILIAANPASDVETDHLKIHSLSELL